MDGLQKKEKKSQEDRRLMNALEKEIAHLKDERALTGAISENFDVAKNANIDFAVCFEVDDEGRMQDVILARTKNRQNK